MAASRAPAAPSRGDQGVHLRPGQDLGQRAAGLRGLHASGGIIGAPRLAEHEAVELPHGRTPPRRRGRGEAARADVCEIGLDILGRRAGRITPPRRQELREVRQVPLIGAQGVGRRAALGRHHFQERFRPFLALHGGCGAIGIMANLGAVRAPRVKPL
jgi:hypothetical protein